MKTRIFYTIAALALFICGGHAEQLSASSPILIRLAEIDRYAVCVRPSAKGTAGTCVGLPYKNLAQSTVDALVRDGVHLHRSVRIMDGQRVVAECHLVGEFINSVSEFGQPPEKAKKEYGLLVGFDTPKEAGRIASALKLQPNLDDLIRDHKKELDDQRFWKAMTLDQTLQATAAAPSVLTGP